MVFVTLFLAVSHSTRIFTCSNRKHLSHLDYNRNSLTLLPLRRMQNTVTEEHGAKMSHVLYNHTSNCLAAQAVSRWLPTAAVRGSRPGLVMWDL
jgi:hypothetical protein